MPGDITFRTADEGDYAFAWESYVAGIRAYTEDLMEWHEGRQSESFRRQWDSGKRAQIIVEGGTDVGWFQAAIHPSEIILQQLFVVGERRGNGIGTAVLTHMIGAWKDEGKPIVLTVLRNNPAVRLYERLGFSVAGEEGVKYRMQRDLRSQ